MASPGTVNGPQNRSIPSDPVLREREDRLESLKALVGKMTHDFNNFLMPFLGYVTLIREEVPGNAAVIQYLDIMEGAARKTESLLDAAFLATRPHRRFSPKRHDLGAIAEAEIAGWQAGLSAVCQIRVQRQIASCPMVLDEGHWRTVFRQLLNNVHFALATGGEVEISLRAEALSPERQAELNVPHASVYKLTVRDTGFGMSEPVLKRAYDPFFTTRPKGQAMGLGLTMVHSVVQLHGGQIHMESRDDEGTTVTIWVPSTGAEGALVRAPGHGRRVEAAVLGQAPKVLLVEDDPLVREVIKTYLQRVPLEVYLAQDGEEGLEVYRKHSESVSLVVSDITMPRMDGIQFYQELRKLDPKVRVILMTGNTDVLSKDVLAQFGPDRPLLMEKPFTLKTFTETIRAQLGIAT